VTFANFYRPLPGLSLDADVSFAHARLGGVSAAANRIPGALERVVAGGIAWSPARGAFAAVRARHFGAYPLVEDGAVRARAATLLNADVGYQLSRGARLQATILNLADAYAEDIQYFYESRLRGGPVGGVGDVHSHPVEPRQVRLSLGWAF
jgi:outer membrane receptor protein involved in Fe transport